jgi:PPOX class probable F420-dependent enzyme
MRELPAFDGFEGRQYTALTTYRKNGTPVVTPVWFVKLDGKLIVWTAKDSGKAKRLRNNPCVTLGPSNHSGKLLGSVVEGTARFVPESEHPALKEAFQKKYGLLEKLFAAIWKIQGHQHTYIEISLPNAL